VNPTDVFHSGSLGAKVSERQREDHYVYDPLDVSHAALESQVDPESRTDQRLTYAGVGKQLIYHSQPFSRDIEVSGFFSLSVWLSIDQPDTDFRVAVYVIDVDGSAVLLSTDIQRARYREGLREEKLISTQDPLCYTFDRFTFVSCLIRQGGRLRLVIGPLSSINWQKNYNSGRPVSQESARDARPVKVILYHGKRYPSALFVPIAQPDTPEGGGGGR
jgi:putative CocE/NonD family hydrolase